MTDIASIIISRPDKLAENEIIFLLEKIIENYDIDQQTTSNDFSDEKKNDKCDISKIDEFYKKYVSISNYRKIEYSKKDNLSPIKIQYLNQPFNFFKIKNSLDSLCTDSINDSSFQETVEAANILNSILPIRSTIAPSSNSFFLKNVDCYTFDFKDNALSQKLINNLGPFGLSSNGQFIFLLSSLHLFYIFPILNNGALMPPKIVRLPFKEIKDDSVILTTESCITSFPDSIEIHPYPTSFNKVIININEFVSQDDYSMMKNDQSNEMKLDIENIKLVDSNEYLCKITNGVVNVIVNEFKYQDSSLEIGFSCDILDIKTGKHIRKVKLAKNHQQINNKCDIYRQWDCDPLLPELFPDLNYCNIPIETNGTTISFIFEVQKEIAIYRTFSLITGEFLSDEKIYLSSDDSQMNHIIATNVDSVNNCRWILTTSSDNKVSLRKMQYKSSVDPYIFQIEDIIDSTQKNKFLETLNNLLRYFCCSTYTPSFLLCQNIEDFHFLLKLLKISIEKNNNNQLLLQTLCLLISLNMINNEEFCSERKSIFNLLYNNFEIGLKFLLFFPSFSTLFKIDANSTVSLLFSLFSEATQKIDKNDLLISYSLKILENCLEFATFPLLKIEKMQDLIKNDSFLSLFIVHQHALTQKVQHFLENENLIENQTSKQTPLDALKDYTRLIVSIFLESINACQIESNSNPKNKFDSNKLNEFSMKPIYKLFHNFLHLLTPLTQNHIVSQVASVFFTSLLKIYIQIPDSNNSMKIDLLETCYLYGLFVSTLVSGGGLNPFEEKYIWVIRSNLDLLKNDELLHNLNAKIDGIEFIEKDDVFTLNFLYSKIKQPFNKNLTPDVKTLDKCVILAISQHMNCLHELLFICNSSTSDLTNVQISPLLRHSFLQMQRIRNKYKSTPNDRKSKEYNNFIIKSHILLKLKSFTLFTNDVESRAKILADFILSSYSPEYIKGIFLMQKNRIPTTQIGFALINDTFNNDKSQRLISIIGHVMNKFLTNFEGLNSILCMEGNSYLNREDLNTFFENIYPLTNLQNEKTVKTRIIPYRFFKSIKIFPDLLESFLANLLKSFDLHHSNDPGFYSLVILMIKLIDSIQQVPFQTILLSIASKSNEMNAYKLSIIEHMLEKINDDFVLPDEFITMFFNDDSLLTSPINIKIVMRIRYLLINIVKNDSLDSYLKEYLLFIGDHLYDSNKYYSFLVTELITLLRKIYLQVLNDESSPMRNNSFYLLLMNSISNKNNYNERVAFSLCAIFGFQMEAINPYSVIKVCLNEDSNNTFLLINHSNELFKTDNCICYPLPFDVLNEPQEFKSLRCNSFITVVPEVTYTNVVFADKLKSMLMTTLESTKRFKIFPVCAQALLTFYTINPEIITSNDSKLIEFMCTKITHFNDIYQTFNRIKSFNSILNGKSKSNTTNSSIQILPDLSFEFGELRDNSSSTYLSFPIKNDAPVFLVNIEIIDNDDVITSSKIDSFNFGVISDSLEEEEIRISTIGFPSGVNFPENAKIFEFKNAPRFNKSNQIVYNVSFVVKMKEKKMLIENSTEIGFPIGRQFRLIIFTKKKNSLTFKPTFSVENQIEASELIFDFNSPPDLDEIISVKRSQNYEDFDFLKIPEFIENMKFNPNEKRILKEDYHQYSKIDKFSNEFELNKKLKLMPFLHPMNPVLHINKTLGASTQLIEHHLKGLYLKLGRQWITVLLMKITMNNASIISKFAFDLFSTFSVPLESFNQEEFDQNRFPFSLENPPWKSSTNSSSLEDDKKPSFYFLATNDMVNALSSLIKNYDCMDRIAEGLLKMSSSNNLHQIALPHKYLIFKVLSNANNKLVLNRQSIVSFNDYEGLHKNAAFVTDSTNKTFYDLPFIYKKNNESDLSMDQLNVVENEGNKQLSILEVNTSNSSLKNHWVINTPIELLIHLKNFALAAKSENHLSLVKTILLDLFLGKSPFVLPYIDQFQDFVQMKCSASLFYRDPLYIKHLIALACYLNSMEKPDENYVFLYENEQRLMSSNFTIYDAAHFPEFFPLKSKLPTPTTDTILIPYEPIDPGLIKEGFQSRILTIKLLFQKHESIVGCHFWEILPLWNRIVEIYGFDNKIKTAASGGNDDDDEDDPNFAPTMSKVDDNIIKISNPTKNEFNVYLKFRRRMLTTELRNLTFQYSTVPTFEDANFVQYYDFDKPIRIKKGDTFFSILSDSTHSPWGSLCDLQIDTTNKRKSKTNSGINKDHLITVTKEYKTEFVQSMKTFYLHWNQENTEKLLNMFELDQLKSPSFETIAQIVLESDLNKIFPKSVLLLRSLLIHQFSYIRYHHNDKVSSFLWNSCANLVPILEKCTILRESIKTNDHKFIISIDRGAAISLINDYNNKNSENGQRRSKELCFVENRYNSIISQFASKIESTSMDSLRGIKPFSVRFSNEDGVDVGGPTKDLLNEAASSIFEPSSQLFMKANCDEEFFIPETRKRATKISQKTINNEYFAIGVLIAIVCRTGLPQYFPFAPFIYKYIAGEIITPDDIAEVDKDFEIEVRNVRNKQTLPDWTATTWTSPEKVALQGRILVSKESNNNNNSNDEDEDDDNGDDEVERYLNEYTKFRVNLLIPMLQKIREGFVANTEIHSHPLLSGKVLSFLAQGSADITTAQLKEITKVMSFGDDLEKTVDIFWSVVDEFTVEQRRALLKFITGITRIPKIKADGVAPFYINIQQMQTEGALNHPDDQLPTSSTCFNKIYLPKYTNKDSAKSKILYAIQNCLTMEKE